MSLANWTTRIFVGNAKAHEAPVPAPEQPTGHDLSADPATLLAPGSRPARRIGNYVIKKRLGAGGVGEVFKAVDAMLGREVAIKVLRDELAADPVFLARFRNEAQLQAKLNHPNVARVFAFLEEADKPFMVMEYVAGVSLEDFVRSGGPVPVTRALDIFRRVLDGVAHAHSHGIVHRDLKPANIMLADNGEVKVMDFGIARALDSQEHLTRIGHVAGTAKVMSPEQICGQSADARSDVYSLGIVLYTLLAGRPPFDHEDDLALMKAQLEQAPPPLRSLVADLPPGVELAVMHALEKNPMARFQTAREFAAAIEACQVEPSDHADATQWNALDAQTQSRTIVNPVVDAIRAEPREVLEPVEPLRRAGGASPSRWLGIGGAAVALTAVAAAVAWVWQKPTAVELKPVVASTVALAPAATPVLEATPAAPALPAAKAAAQQVVQPAAPVRTLAVTRVGEGARNVGDGGMVRAGERIQLQVVTSHDAHVYCFLQDESRRVVRFFPNRFQGSSLVKAGEPLELPGKMRFEIVANARQQPETVACFASDRDLGGELSAGWMGTDFAAQSGTTLDSVRIAVQGLSTAGLAESSYTFRAR